jgi:UDPglucose 6-dehydrogenase
LYRSLDLNRLKDVMVYPLIVDGRNLFDLDEVRSAGLSYYPTGRPAVP